MPINTQERTEYTAEQLKSENSTLLLLDAEITLDGVESQRILGFTNDFLYLFDGKQDNYKIDTIYLQSCYVLDGNLMASVQATRDDDSECVSLQVRGVDAKVAYMGMQECIRGGSDKQRVLEEEEHGVTKFVGFAVYDSTGKKQDTVTSSDFQDGYEDIDTFLSQYNPEDIVYLDE